MTILGKLSSQIGDRTQYSNSMVAIECLENPVLLEDIAVGLMKPDAALVGDCAEVMTKVAQTDPEWVAPYAHLLAASLVHKVTRVRWEAMHALSLVTTSTPVSITPMLPMLMDKLRNDASVIVRDYAADTIANYASTGSAAAECAYPLLKETLTLWAGKQAGHALIGLAHVARLVPGHRDELGGIAEDFSHSPRAVVRKAAKALSKVIKSSSTEEHDR